MILLALLLAAAPTPAPTPPSRLDADAAAVARTGAALQPHVEGTWLDGKPGSDRLAAAHWAAVQRWAADWLDLHPNADAAAMARAGKRFGDRLSISAVRLGHGDMLVATSGIARGNVFILGVDGRGGHRLRWSTAAPQRRLDRATDRALSLWRPAVQNAACNRCQMMVPDSIGRLPDRADGTARFWIKAVYAREMSETGIEQLSLWSWRDGRAQPVLLHDIVVMMEQDGPAVRGRILYVPAKGDWRSLSVCGSCFGRVTDLRYAIGPGRIQALPPLGHTPELDLIDRVYARVLSHQPVGALATPAVVRVIRTALRDRLAETDPQMRLYSGMIMGWNRWSAHGRRWTCLASDEITPLAFAFDASLRRITEARALGAGACQGQGSRD
jgi:hypothetical protein